MQGFKVEGKGVAGFAAFAFEAGTQVGVWRTWDRKGRLVKETELRKRPRPDRR